MFSLYAETVGEISAMETLDIEAATLLISKNKSPRNPQYCCTSIDFPV